MAVFWIIGSCSLVEIIRTISRPDDGGSKDIRNVGRLQPDYTALQPRRQP
jgi:hypothetical protein